MKKRLLNRISTSLVVIMGLSISTNSFAQDAEFLFTTANGQPNDFFATESNRINGGIRWSLSNNDYSTTSQSSSCVPQLNRPNNRLTSNGNYLEIKATGDSVLTDVNIHITANSSTTGQTAEYKYLDGSGTELASGTYTLPANNKCPEDGAFTVTPPAGAKSLQIIRSGQTIRIFRIQVWAKPESTQPVQFTSFTAKAGNNGIDLAWSTTSEQNTKNFVIERTSTSGVKSISVAATGNSSAVQNYNITDTDVTAGETYYYSLKSVDNDNEETVYGEKKSVKYGIAAAGISVYPNPAQDKITVAGVEGGAVKVLSLDGKIVATSASSTVDVSALSAGVYVVVYENAGEQVSTKFVKK